MAYFTLNQTQIVGQGNHAPDLKDYKGSPRMTISNCKSCKHLKADKKTPSGSPMGNILPINFIASTQALCFGAFVVELLYRHQVSFYSLSCLCPHPEMWHLNCSGKTVSLSGKQMGWTNWDLTAQRWPFFFSLIKAAEQKIEQESSECSLS